MAWMILVLLAIFGAPIATGGPGSREAGDDGLTIAIGPPDADALGRLPPVTRARDPNAPLVVIDAGHGGDDYGATSTFSALREKDITLILARTIRDELARTGRVQVALTRDEDRFLRLQDRYEIARRLGADLFISLHADAAPSNDAARGATVYTLSEVASDRETALLAARENEADLVGARLSPDPEVNLILIDLAQRESMNVSAEFARLLYREGASVFPFRPVWHRFASFVVLKAPDIPSVLFESGYLTNQADAAYLQSSQGQRQIADGMRRAIEAHFARRLLSAQG